MGACQLRTKTRFTALVLASVACAGMAATGGCRHRQRAQSPAQVPEQRLGDAVRLAEQAERAMQRGRKDEAIALYRQSIEASPDLALAWHNLGVLLMEQRNYIDAVEAFKAAADLAPQDPRPYYMIGVAYDHQGWAEPSLSYFIRSLERSPNYIPALRGSVRAAKRLDRADRASLERARRALAVEPENTWRHIHQREALRIEGVLRQETTRIELGGSIGAPSAGGSQETPAPQEP
jgi:tetratricopeptide (TPR) repeat protein